MDLMDHKCLPRKWHPLKEEKKFYLRRHDRENILEVYLSFSFISSRGSRGTQKIYFIYLKDLILPPEEERLLFVPQQKQKTAWILILTYAVVNFSYFSISSRQLVKKLFVCCLFGRGDKKKNPAFQSCHLYACSISLTAPL